jgi:hypothetical protein
MPQTSSPVPATRKWGEVIEICRKVWRREPVTHYGVHYQIPLPDADGAQSSRPLKFINYTVRERIPISHAAIGDRNVALAAEIAEGC